MKTPSQADAMLAAIHAELSALHEPLAKLRDSLPNGEAKREARRYAEHIERALQQIERLIE